MKKHKYANFQEEFELWKRGCRLVVGLDEAGRGPLAGPVVAAAFCFGEPKQTAAAKLKIFQGMKDSKKLSAKQRAQWYEILTSDPDFKHGVGIVSEKVIDKINIFEATKLAMLKAVGDLKKHLYQTSDDRQMSDRGRKRGEFDFLIIDGNFTIEDLPIKQKAIVRADEKVISCAAASIIAKVTRDKLMQKYAKKYPEYGFEKHKGYGTRAHCELLKKRGPCEIHRRSFKPIKSLLPK